MKIFFKIIGAIILFLALLIISAYFIYNEKIPNGKQGAKADSLAIKMVKALNYQAYKNTQFLEWSFRDKHHYKWDKKNHIVTVSWDKNKVILHTQNPKKSSVFIAEKPTQNKEILQKAVKYFNNDSFWLVAPYKVFEAGVKRSIVNYKNKEALLITYTTGGSTPGDSYLWVLDKNGLPTAYKMWVSIIPIGGLEASWNNWKTTQSGAKLPTEHRIQFIGKLKMGNVKAYN